MDAHIQIQFNKLHYSTNGLNLFFSRPKTLSLKFLAESKVATPKNVKGMPDIAIITKGVEGFLKCLITNKASGPYKISPRFLKELHHDRTHTYQNLQKLLIQRYCT